MNEVRYYQDHDNRNLIVRVWYGDDGERHGEYWYLGKSDSWIENETLAWMVADEIYENHPLSDKVVEELIGQKQK